MKLKQSLARSLQVSLMSWVMGGGAIATFPTPVVAQLDLIEDTAPDRNLGTQIQRDVVPGVDLITGGTRPQNGQNLFHSFQEFNIRENRGAYFQNPVGVRNILTRVTGYDPSDILGTLGVLGTANLFFINPNGIIFGRNASLDLRGGSFYGTTASGIKFGDVGEFSAVNPQLPSNLLTINPSAFFFTSRERQGEIINQSQADQNVLGNFTSGLRVRNGQTLLLLGGNVTVDGGELNAWGGRVEIGAIAGVGTVRLDPNGGLSVPEELQRANVNFINRALVDVALDNGGDIGVTADNINLLNDSALIAGISFGLGPRINQAGDITLNATGLVQVVGQSSGIANNVNQNATGNSGNLRILADVLEVKDGAQLQAATLGRGNAGNVMIVVRDRILFSGSNTSAFSSVAAGAEGQGGSVQIDTSVLEVFNGAQLVAATQGIGDAGNVIINAHDQVLFSGTSADGQFSSTALSSVAAGAEGNGGNVQIDTSVLEVLNGAQLTADTRGIGDAGNVIINARDRVLFSGTSADGQFPSGAFSGVNVGAEGNGGNVQIDTSVLEVLNGAELLANTEGRGNAGNVIINARDRVLFDYGDAFSSVNAGSQGNGGNVQIDTSVLEVLNGAQLTADTRGIGDAGNVIINARDRVLFSGTSADGQFPSGALSGVNVGAEGNGGNVQIDTSVLEVLNGARLQAATEDIGDAGNVIINARDRVLFDDGNAFSSVAVGAEGKGGNVQIDTSVLEVLNGAQLIASTEDIGDAGNVIITARDAVRVSGTEPSGLSSGLFVSTFADGQGGNITVNTRTFQMADGGVIDARTYATGNSGNVVINAETVNLLNGGQLLAITQGSGRAGNITVNASERLTISGTDPTYAPRLAQFGDRVAPVSESSGIFVRSQSSDESRGGAGDVTVTTPQIHINQGVISAESAAVNGGNINLNVGRLLMRSGSLISATAGTGQQGGNGGNITINAPNGFIIGVKSENSDITANAFTGSGGRVNITAQGIFGLEFRPNLTPFSDITASSSFGASGVVTLNTLNVDPNRGLVQLPQNLIDTNRILANSCIVRDVASGGTFLVTGTGGLPVRPGDAPLPSFSTGKVRGVEAEGATTPNPVYKTQSHDSIIEAQGIYKLPSGQVILSWECSR